MGDAAQELRFVADAMRLQAASVFKTGPIEAFSSLTAKRLHKNVAYVRGYARAVFGTEAQSPFVMAGNQKIPIKQGLLEAAKFAATSLDVSHREPFTVDEVLGKTEL